MYREALQVFQRASEFYAHRDEEELLAKTRWSMARILRHQDKIKESLDIQIQLLEQYGGIDESGYVHEELGELYLIRENASAAAHHFNLAYEFLCRDNWLAQNAGDRLARLRKLSQIQI